MSHKPIIAPTRIYNAATSGSFNTDPTSCRFLDNLSYQVIWEDGVSMSGSFAVQATIDGTSWSNLELTDVPTITGTSGNFLINLNQLPFDQFRGAYTHGTGTADIEVWVCGKRI